MFLKIFKSHHPIRHAKSFKHAFDGIFHAALNEANFRVQIVIAAVTIGWGMHFRISSVEWALLTLALGLLLAMELINTAIEEFMDFLTEERHEGAKVIKDVSAGFVLVTAIMFLTILFFIFAPYFMDL